MFDYGNLLDVEFDEQLAFDGTVSNISDETDRMIRAMIRATPYMKASGRFVILNMWCVARFGTICTI